MMSREQNIHRHQQRGYLLIFVAVILIGLVMISINFFTSNIAASKVTGYSRDAEEAFMLAEAVMNRVYGGFIYEEDFDNDNTVDNQIQINLDSPLPLPLRYMYVVSNADVIKHSTPSILQRIADGEARASGGSVDGQIVSETSTTVMIGDLYSSNTYPISFINSANGLQQIDDTWDNLPSLPGKAAAWIEVVRDKFQPNKLYLFVQTAAQVGRSKSYVQRYMGEFTDTLGGQVNALTESNPLSAP